MPNRARIPERIVRAMDGTPEWDKENRILPAQVMTRGLARDGGIIVPEGIVERFYEENPVVLARHGRDGAQGSPVIGRSLGLEHTPRGMRSVTQFAETDLALEYAYLYGMNDGDEVYMRAWSFGWNNLELEWWSIERTKKWLGADWDEEVVDYITRKYDEVWASTRSEMLEYSAVAVGSDREALSRAFGAGVNTAGNLIAQMDLHAARRELARLTGVVVRQQVESLTRRIQALSRDGAAAARRGDSAGVLAEIRGLTERLRGETDGRGTEAGI